MSTIDRSGLFGWISSLGSNSDRILRQIQPMSASVNTERVILHITGSFHDVSIDTVKVTVIFPLPNQSPYFCTIQSLHQDRLP